MTGLSSAEAEAAAVRTAAWWRRHLLWPLAAWTTVVAWWSWTGWDHAAMEPWATAEGFPLRGDFWWSTVLHEGGRKLSAALAIALFLAALLQRRLRPGARWTGSALAVASGLGLGSLVVAALKALTDHPCPWDLAEWGGALAHLGPDPGRGPIHGWPAAHASAGFGWIGLYFAARWHARPRPWLWALPGLALGLLFAATQHVRGAHFPSHNAWTLLICWASALLIHAARAARMGRRGSRARPAGGPAGPCRAQQGEG